MSANRLRITLPSTEQWQHRPLYEAIVALRPEWHAEADSEGAIKVVMTGSASDKPLLRPHIYSKQVKKRLEKRFKDP